MICNINMDNNYQRDEHRIHLIVYHLVWTPKRRKPVLVAEVGQRLQKPDRTEMQ